MNSNSSYSPETPNLGQIRRFLEPCDLEIWRMTLNNNRAPLLCYFKLCASFRSYRWFQTGDTVWKRNLGLNRRFLEPRDLAIWRMTLKNNRAPLYATSSFVHHFVVIGEFKLELQSGNAQFGSKSTIFFSRVTLQFDIWPWKTKGYLYYATSSFVQHFVAIDEFKLELQSGNAQFGSNSTIFISVWPWNLTADLEKQ